MKMSEDELMELAAQLRSPQGESGIRVAEMMQFTNIGLIHKTIDNLSVKDGNDILEIGPGNGAHLQYLLNNAQNILYKGVDISETMIIEAAKINAATPNTSFLLSDGKTIPFEDGSFDRLFTVNTIYFWEHPQAYANEVARVLRSGGVAAIGLIPKSTMQHIPFSKYGFTLYDADSVSVLLKNSGLKITRVETDKEFVTSNSGEQIEREILIVTAVKN